ncbi:MAG: hypothetical protein Q8K58_10745, partial [Acidimicrobiales bacterium]|nr:hypothetical protein [Acidimicrobiales bacterium]
MDQRRRSHQQLILLVAAVAGGLLAAEPTGVAAADVVWSGGFVLGLAYVGGYAPRWVALTAAGCVSLVADTRLSLGLAIAAVALAAYNARQGRRSLRWGTLGSALVALSLLTGSGPEDRVLAAITTTTISVLLAVGGATGMRPRQRRRLLRRGAMGLGVVGLFALAGGLAALLARSNVDRGIDDFRAAQVVATNGDLAAAVQEFRSAEQAFRAADRPLSTFGRMGRLVPGLSQQLAAADAAVEAAGSAAEAAAVAGAEIDLDAVGVNAGRVDLVALRRTEAPVEELVAT